MGCKVNDLNLAWGGKVSDYGLGWIQDEIQKGLIPVLHELELDVELPGTHVVLADHHGKRSGEASALLQVIYLLGEVPTRHHLLVSANDVGYIPAMLQMGASWEEVEYIRLLDRQAQGITAEQEAIAVEAIGKLQKFGNLWVVRMAHSKAATVTDRLFGKQPRQNVLVLSDDGEANYYGPGDRCAILKEKFEGWNGGSGLGHADGNAYWGGYPVHEELLNYLILLEKAAAQETSPVTTANRVEEQKA